MSLTIFIATPANTSTSSSSPSGTQSGSGSGSGTPSASASGAEESGDDTDNALRSSASVLTLAGAIALAGLAAL